MYFKTVWQSSKVGLTERDSKLLEISEYYLPEGSF
jgi:hypothetical protein